MPCGLAVSQPRVDASKTAFVYLGVAFGPIEHRAATEDHSSSQSTTPPRMRVVEVVIDVSAEVSRLSHVPDLLQGFKSYAVRTVISGW